MSATDVKTEVRKVASLVGGARRLLAEGKIVELSALEGKVKAMCEALKHAPPEVAKGLEKPVGAIIEDLDRLQADLTAQHRSLAERLENDERQRAAKAYRKVKDET